MGIDPVELRRQNMVGAEDFPFTSNYGSVYDSGQPIATMELAMETVGYDDFEGRLTTAF